MPANAAALSALLDPDSEQTDEADWSGDEELERVREEQKHEEIERY